MFTSIVNFTILNATRKRDAYPRHKGVWTDRTQNELSATPTQQSYAQYMGGVDRLDQMSRVNKEKKSLRWYRKIEFKLREVSIYNAYVLEGCVTSHQRPNKRKWDLMSFKLELAYSLMGDFSYRKAFKRPRADTNEQRLDGKDHWPKAAGGNDHVCVVCNKKHRNFLASHPVCSYKDNPFKRTKTTMACQKCEVPLCCNARNTCYVDYHTKVCYW